MRIRTVFIFPRAGREDEDAGAAFPLSSVFVFLSKRDAFQPQKVCALNLLPLPSSPRKMKLRGYSLPICSSFLYR